MKVVVSIEAGVIASLKVALSAWLMGTTTAPSTGTVEITVGGVAAGAVLNVHGKLLASDTPERSWAAVVMVAVKTVLVARSAAGVNVTTAPVQPMVPGTGVVPGPVTVNAAAGNAGQFMGSLKVALSTWLTGTPVVVFAGTVEITVRAGKTWAAVVKDHT